MYTYQKYFSFLTAVCLALFLNGCSFSHSSKSISKSLKGSSGSVSSIVSSPSNSSKTGEEYQQDIEDYTQTYVKSTTTDYASFQKGLTDIADSHGVVDWESDSTTFIAIGKGLKRANVEGVSYETYKKNLTGSDETKMQEIQEGYDSE